MMYGGGINMMHEEIKFSEALKLNDPWPHVILNNFFSPKNKEIILNFFEKNVPKKELIENNIIPRQTGLITWHGFESKNITSYRDSIMVNYFTPESKEEGIKI